jgi:hypothetical protein
MLSAVRQAPGAGRDLYASPDGGVYQRRNDGWYRRQPGGGWNFYAPTEGTIARNEAVAAARAQNLGRGQLGAGNVYRPVAAQPGSVGRAAVAANRIPNAGGEQRAQQVAALERQYYARAIAQMRAQNSRAGNAARGARRGGGRRR